MRAGPLLLALFLALPASARAFTACDLVTRDEVEAMLDAKTTGAVVDDMNLCAGVCASVNAQACEFQTADGSRQFILEVLLPPYAFGADNERLVFFRDRDEDRRAFAQEVPGLGQGAFWYFHSRLEQSLLFTYPSARVHVTVQQLGIKPGAAYTNAVRAARRAMARFHGGKLDFRSIGDAYPSHP